MPKTRTKAKSVKAEAVPSVLTFANPRADDELTPLNFRVPAQFHREFKLFAVQHDISMVELLQRSFQLMKGRR
ncbi:MAG: hypothetical protein LC114_03450 [Bryobacterales bacterium]|nr:hypothetical protein [Bryobacterales bacterium]